MKRCWGIAAVVGTGAYVASLGFVSGNSSLSLIGMCALLGSFIKSMDQVIDLPSWSGRRWPAFPLAVGVASITVFLALEHDPVFGVVMGTAIGLLLAGKMDHPAFYVAGLGFVFVMIVLVRAFDAPISQTSWYLVPMAAMGSFLDESMHERYHDPDSGWVNKFFEHRPLLKLVAVIAVMINFAEVIHLIGFLAFDLAYDGIAVSWVD